MNFQLIRLIASRFGKSDKSSRFMRFARYFALFSVMLGSMALIIALSVLDGFETVIKTGIMKFRSHVTVTSFNEQYLPKSNEIIDKISAYKGVLSVYPIIENEALIRSDAYTEGILLRGITLDYSKSHISSNIKEGKYEFSSPTSNEIVIGAMLAARLGVNQGETVVVYAIKNINTDNFQFPEVERFTITGIYETGLAKYDDIFAYIPFEKASQLFDLPEQTTSIYEVTLVDPSQANTASFGIYELLGSAFYCFSVFELHRDIFAWIDLQKAPIPIVLALISLVAVLNIITILLISVIEKTRSTSILKALGMRGKDIMFVFVFRGIMLGFVGTALGCGLGFLFGMLQNNYGLIRLKAEIYFLDSLPVDMKIWHFLIVSLLTIILSFICSLVPSYLAVRMKPIKALTRK